MKKKTKTQSERQTTRQQKNTVQKCQSHEKQRQTELSQIRRDQGDTAMKCNVKTTRRQATD